MHYCNQIKASSLHFLISSLLNVGKIILLLFTGFPIYFNYYLIRASEFLASQTNEGYEVNEVEKGKELGKRKPGMCIGYL